VRAEGWYRDPFGIHQDRWISDGRPTSLVRDGQIESQDEPPTDDLPGTLTPSIPETNTEHDGLVRADDWAQPEQAYKASGSVDAALARPWI
jgi:hypothetical protein